MPVHVPNKNVGFKTSRRKEKSLSPFLRRELAGFGSCGEPSKVRMYVYCAVGAEVAFVGVVAALSRASCEIAVATWPLDGRPDENRKGMRVAPRTSTRAAKLKTKLPDENRKNGESLSQQLCARTHEH